LPGVGLVRINVLLHLIFFGGSVNEPGGGREMSETLIPFDIVAQKKLIAAVSFSG